MSIGSELSKPFKKAKKEISRVYKRTERELKRGYRGVAGETIKATLTGGLIAGPPGAFIGAYKAAQEEGLSFADLLGMGAPEVPAYPKIPAIEDPAVEEARRRERERARRARGRTATIATGPMGLAGPASTQKKVLMGA